VYVVIISKVTLFGLYTLKVYNVRSLSLNALMMNRQVRKKRIIKFPLSLLICSMRCKCGSSSKTLHQGHTAHILMAYICFLLLQSSFVFRKTPEQRSSDEHNILQPAGGESQWWWTNDCRADRHHQPLHAEGACEDGPGYYKTKCTKTFMSPLLFRWKNLN